MFSKPLERNITINTHYWSIDSWSCIFPFFPSFSIRTLYPFSFLRSPPARSSRIPHRGVTYRKHHSHSLPEALLFRQKRPDYRIHHHCSWRWHQEFQRDWVAYLEGCPKLSLVASISGNQESWWFECFLSTLCLYTFIGFISLLHKDLVRY